jgi:hypothetical protein
MLPTVLPTPSSAVCPENENPPERGFLWWTGHYANRTDHELVAPVLSA